MLKNKALFLQMDTDGNGKIDFEEFLVSMAERRNMHDSMEDLRKVCRIFFPFLTKIKKLLKSLECSKTYPRVSPPFTYDSKLFPTTFFHLLLDSCSLYNC